jgi:hypothetical protein
MHLVRASVPEGLSTFRLKIKMAAGWAAIIFWFIEFGGKLSKRKAY